MSELETESKGEMACEIVDDGHRDCSLQKIGSSGGRMGSASRWRAMCGWNVGRQVVVLDANGSHRPPSSPLNLDPKTRKDPQSKHRDA